MNPASIGNNKRSTKMTKQLEIWGTKTFKKWIDVSDDEYAQIKQGDHCTIANIIHDRNDWGDGPDGVKVKRMTVDVFDTDDNTITTELELL